MIVCLHCLFVTTLPPFTPREHHIICKGCRREFRQATKGELRAEEEGQGSERAIAPLTANER